MATNSFVRVPPDSTGKRLHALAHTVDATPVHVQTFHMADPDNPENAVAVDVRGAASIRFSEGQPTLSGFGGLNVTQGCALGVYESSSGSYDALFSINTVSGGTNVYDDIGHSVLLGTSTLNGSEVTRTTNRYHYYLPGSANIAIFTASCGDTGKAGNARRWGAFDDNDGIFFELYESTINAVIRSSTTGAVVEVKVPKGSWNSDPLDGTGPSGMILDITKVNLWWIDYQWLGAGRVRFGVFAPDGSRVTCHYVANGGEHDVPYMRAGTLPLRTQNINFAGTGSTSQLREVCMAMYSEGKYDDWTFWRASDLDATNVTVGATDTLLFAVRSKLTAPGLNHHNNVIAYPETLNVYCDQPFRLDITQDVTATGGTWNVTNGDVTIEGSLDTVITDSGTPFKTIFFGPGTHSMDLTSFFEINDEGIGLNADSTQEVWAFTGKRLSGTNSNVTVNLGYKELW